MFTPVGSEEPSLATVPEVNADDLAPVRSSQLCPI